MFEKNFVVCIKVNGKILRDINGIAKLPFGTEFIILLKNLNTVRAQVSVSIDGTDVTESVYLVVEPNSELELTRYIKNGNLNQGNCFKFIEMTEGIEKHRGIKADDGVVRVEFQFEKVNEKYVMPEDTIADKLDKIKRELDKKADKGDIWRQQPYYYLPYYHIPPVQPYTIWGGSIGTGQFASSTTTISTTSGTVPITATATGGTATSAFVNTVGIAQNCGTASVSSGTLRSSTDKRYGGDIYAASITDAGITVPGSVSSQKFTMTGWFPVEDEKHVIVLRLVGTSEAGVQYVAPVTVKAKPKCQTCGRVNKATSKFCSDCGTALIVL
jgi:hypothetical protein